MSSFISNKNIIMIKIAIDSFEESHLASTQTIIENLHKAFEYDPSLNQKLSLHEEGIEGKNMINFIMEIGDCGSDPTSKDFINMLLDQLDRLIDTYGPGGQESKLLYQNWLQLLLGHIQNYTYID
jgi:hypothetical protein